MSKALRTTAVAVTVLGLACALAGAQPARKGKPGAKGASWRVYTDVNGDYQVNYPSNWQVLTRGNALVITSPGSGETRGVFGITPRAEGMKVEDAVKKEFDDPNRSPDLQKASSRIANQPAIKVWGAKKGNPGVRMVEYYVQKGNRQYYILFQAPRESMDRYGPVFNGMIGSLKFLN